MIVKICWFVLGLIHAMPAFAVLKPALLTKMYGTEPGSDIFTVMHHRAALFLVILMLTIWAMFRPEVRQMATAAVGLSMVSFIILWLMSGMSPALRSIAVADAIGIPFLIYVGWQAYSAGA